MNLDAAKARIALIDYIAILVLKSPLPEASQSMHDSANNEIADEMAGGGRFPAPLYILLSIRVIVSFCLVTVSLRSRGK
jgi:hypothetical protein